MQSIIDNDYIIMIISDEYLKSASCMNEILELMKMHDFKKHILPIVLDNRIYIIENQINYIGYWEDECKRLKKRLKEIQIEKFSGFSCRIKKISRYCFINRKTFKNRNRYKKSIV